MTLNHFQKELRNHKQFLTKEDKKILEDRKKWSTCSQLYSAHRPRALVLRTRGSCDFINSNNVLTNQKQKAVITVLLIDIFIDTVYIKQ